MRDQKFWKEWWSEWQREQRTKRGMTQGDMAFQLRMRYGLKVSEGMLGNWESVGHAPNNVYTVAICRLFGELPEFPDGDSGGLATAGYRTPVAA